MSKTSYDTAFFNSFQSEFSIQNERPELESTDNVL